MRTFLNNLQAVREFGLDVKPHDINRLQNLTAWDIGAKQYKKALGKDVSDASDAEIDRARVVVQQNVVDQNEGILLVKTHNILAMVNDAPTINMQVTAGVVYIVRNPLDVVISFSAHMNLSIDETIRIMATPTFRPRNSGNTVAEIYGSWSENVQSWTKHENQALLVLRYEDLHAEPEKYFSKLATHLGQGATESETAKAIELSSFKVLKAMEDERGFYEKPKHLKSFFRSGQTGQWKNQLSDKQIIAVETLHEPMMKKFGYLP